MKVIKLKLKLNKCNSNMKYQKTNSSCRQIKLVKYIKYIFIIDDSNFKKKLKNLKIIKS